MSFARAFAPRVNDTFAFASPFGGNMTPQIQAQAAAHAVATMHAKAQARLAELLRQSKPLAQQLPPQAPQVSALVAPTAHTGSPQPIAAPFASPDLWSALSLAGMGAGAYHGYKRDNSIGWAIVWALLGGLFPVITVPVAIAQGFGKPARGG